MATYYVELDGGKLTPDAALKGGTMSAAVSFSGAVIYPTSGGGGGGANLETKSVSYTPSELALSQTLLPSPGYDGFDEVDVTVQAIPSDYVGSAIPLCDSSDVDTTITDTNLIRSHSVDVDDGYYENPVSLLNPFGTATFAPVGTPYVDPSTGDLTVQFKADTAGMAYTKSSYSITDEGAFNVKGAQTYTPGTTDQTIGSGYLLTGAQTILGDADLVAENIKKDVEIFGVTGTYEGGGGGGWDDSNLLLIAVIESGDAYGDFTFPGATKFHERVFVDLGGSYTIESEDVTSIETYAFYRSSGLTSLKVPNCTTIGAYALGGSTATNQGLQTLYAPNANLGANCANGAKLLVTAVINGTPSSGTRNYHFRNCNNLEAVDANGLMYLDNSFNGATKMNTLVLRRTTANTLANTGTFTGTCFASGGTGGTLYVPADLITTYQNASNWSTILGYPNNNIKSIESTHTDPTAPIDLTLYYVDGTPIPT